MLFYTQIKREFTSASWKRGQTYFREKRVRDVKLEDSTVTGKVRGSDNSPYETSIVMARGTIAQSKCSCPAHREYEPHCKHVAALAIWIVERGSLLRAGVINSESAPEPDSSGNEIQLRRPQKAAADPRLRKLLLSHPELALSRFSIRRDLMAGFVQGKDPQGRSFSIPVTLKEANALLEFAKLEESKGPDYVLGDPVLVVRGIFQVKALAGVSVESGLRYRDPITKTVQVNTLQFLIKQKEPNYWKTTQGVLLFVPPPATDADASFIDRLDTQKVIYTGQAALENLARMLTHKERDRMVFDPAVNVEVRTIPLRLKTLQIGGKQGETSGDDSRQLTYEFGSEEVTLSSAELEDLARYGRLSSQYVWKGDRIYRFETPLSRLTQFANRSGVAALEGSDKPQPVNGFGAIADNKENPLHPIAAYRLSLEMGADNFVVDPHWTEFHEWKKNFEKKRIPRLPEVDYGFGLREYQKNGLLWMWSLYHRGLSALLADDMGLGKTHQVLAFLSSLYSGAPRAKRKGLLPTLVVAPTSVIAAWAQKLKKYETGLRWHIFHGAGRKLPGSDVDIVLTTYGILHREPELRQRDWHCVVLDEAQAIKNASTISARASRALKARFRIAMTGTPVENQATDLWSLMEFLLPGYLGSLPRFKRLYGWGRDVPSDVQAGALKRLVQPFLLRRSKSQVLQELPEKTEEIRQCEMTAVQRKAYRAILNSAEAEKTRANLLGGGKVDYANVLSLLTRLKQICDHPRLADLTAGREKIPQINPFESGKWIALDEILEEALGSNLKVVVFTQYLSVIELVSHFLAQKGVGHTELRGDTPDRSARLERFAADPECKVFLCSLLAGGLGIDLTSASVCIHFDRWWNPAKENQATDRLHRIGQTRGVQVFKFQIPGTVEDRIASIIQSKLQLSDALIEESSAGLKTFSRQELLELLQPVPEDPSTDEWTVDSPDEEYAVHT
jgi:superfamily II DNA or RNA helicase